MANYVACEKKNKSCGNEAVCVSHTSSGFYCLCPQTGTPMGEDYKCPIKPAAIPVTSEKSTKILTPAVNATSFVACDKKPKSCGNEGVCIPFTNNPSVFHCLCPQTGKPMGADFKCPIKPADVVQPSKMSVIVLSGNNSSNTSSNNSIPTNTNPLAVPSYFSSVALVLFIGLIIGLLVLWKCSICPRLGFRRKKNVKNKAFAVQLDKTVLVEERYTTNPQYTSAGGATIDISIGLVPILNRNSISNLEKIGEGYFGEVYKGQLHTRDDEREREETVAVKMLKRTATLEAEEDFMREVEIMSSFQHPNILILVGVCPRENVNPPWMVFEYMPFGDLADVLRNSSHRFWRSTPDLPTLTPESLLSISAQIADGMEYLAGQRFVHRDLACRNCLVGSSLTVKISDFGMSRDVYTCDYYKIGGTRMLPVRWMSPESILYGKFTLESDVWSYGVVLWEIYNYGKQPYYGYTNEEVLKFILDGKLLDIPENCPNEVADIMKLCWKKDPKERIQFLDICNRLSKLKEIIKEVDFSVTSLPRPPSVPVTNYSTFLEMDDNLDEEDYLRPKSPSDLSFDRYLETIP